MFIVVAKIDNFQQQSKTQPREAAAFFSQSCGAETAGAAVLFSQFIDFLNFGRFDSFQNDLSHSHVVFNDEVTLPEVDQDDSNLAAVISVLANLYEFIYNLS